MTPDHRGSVAMPSPPDPETTAARNQVRNVERAVDVVPAPFRLVFMMGVVKQMSIEQTAAALDISIGTAKTRLQHANQQLRPALSAEFATMLHNIWSWPAFVDAFPVEEVLRCQGVTHQFRQRMVELVGSGRTPEELSREYESTAQAIWNCVSQAERDGGRRANYLRRRNELRRHGCAVRTVSCGRSARSCQKRRTGSHGRDRHDTVRAFRFMSAHQTVSPIFRWHAWTGANGSS